MSAMDGPASDGAIPELDLAFPPRPEYVGTARHTVAALARLHEIGDDVIDDLKLAVSEACTNAVSANLQSGEGDPVRLVARVDEGALVIEVFDVGPTHEGIDDMELPTDEVGYRRGLSLPLIRGLVDQLEIEPRPGQGSILRMRLAFSAVEELGAGA